MTVQMSEHEARIERESVEWVFGLTGGELDDKPVTYTYDGGEGVFHYTFDGVPDYASSDFDDLHSNDCDYFTAVTCQLYGAAPDEITVGGKRYTQVSSFVSSGETECCYAQSDDG